MIKGKFYTVTLHILGWIAFFSLPLIFIMSQSTGENGRPFTGNLFDLLSFTAYIAIFYIHTYFLFPKLYFRKKRLLYFLSIGLLFSGIFFLRPFDRVANQVRSREDEIFKRPGPPPGDHDFAPIKNTPARAVPSPRPPGRNGPWARHLDIISIALFILVIVLSIALIMEKRWKIAVQEASRAEADKANAELSFLKAQINPHFLFNTLNNIYSLAVTKNENVADAIMKLSNIMRYVTDDVNEDFVSLEKELDSISDYISLQRLRLGKKACIDFIIEGDTASKEIAPLILMPFVENAFKHGVSSAAASTIIIKLTATGKAITFYTENKLFATPRNAERTGIGSTNTKKRLARIYPGKYLLETGAENGLFTVHLVMYI